MNIKEMQAKIDDMKYWDAQLLDFKIQYLGDEAKLYIQQYRPGYGETEYCYEITFLRCYKVAYDTDAGWLASGERLPDGTFEQVISRKYNIKDVTLFGVLLSYAAQDIEVSEYNYFLTRCHIVVANMTIDIICQDIEIKVVPIVEQNFFFNYMERIRRKNSKTENC